MYRIPFGKAALMAAVASLTLAGSFAVPQVAAAQNSQYDDDGPPPGPGPNQAYDDCRRDQTNRAVTGGVLGAVAGAVIGNSVSHGRDRGAATVVGGVAGGAVGAGIGGSTAACDQGGPGYGPPPPPNYAENDGPPPPPPPPPPGYNGDDRGPGPGYRQAPQENCGPADERIRYPDGSVEHNSVQACQGPDGRWRVDD
jgi:hypothetical protein